MLIYKRNERDINETDAGRLARALGVSLTAARLLVSRGASDETAAEEFLHPDEGRLHDPFLFPDMEKAVARIRRAIASGERICVFGDYDADGVSATATLMLYLSGARADCFYMIPSRHDEGYGMNMDSAQRIRDAGGSLIITVDNGVKAVDELDACYALGMEAIVTDHHILGKRLPRAEAILSAAALGGYPNADICGAGIALKLVEALAGREEAMEYIALAGIATVADIVPLTGENRAFAALAVKNVNEGKAPLGITALIAAAGKKGKLSERDFGFVIGPRLNAAGRLEDASLAVELLTETDPGRARERAMKLDSLNTARKDEENAVTTEAAATLDAGDLSKKRSIVLSSPSWNPGVVGIAAGRIAERYFRPTVLLSEKDGVLTGSARSIPGVDLHEAMKNEEELFMRFGGHAFAAGVTLKKENLGEFSSRLDEYIQKNVSDETFIPSRGYDLDAELASLTLPLARELAAFAPFGEGNPEPVFRTDGARLRSLRRSTDGKHLSLTVASGDQYADGMFFYAGDRFDELNGLSLTDALYTVHADDYFEAERMKLFFSAIRPSEGDIRATVKPGKFMDAISADILYNSKYNAASFTRGDAEEAFAKGVRASITGTLAVCFTPGGAERLAAFAGENGLLGRFDVLYGSCKNDPSAYNAAVFAPRTGALNAGRYSRVIVFDAALAPGTLGRLRDAAPGAELIVPVPAECGADALISELTPGRERLAALYKALARTRGEYYNVASMGDALADVSGESAWICAAALAVFSELGFVDTASRARLVRNAKPQSLESSPTYAALRALRGEYEKYSALFKED